MGLGSNSEGVVRGGLTEEETLEAKKSKEARTPPDFAGPVSGGGKWYLWPVWVVFINGPPWGPGP